MFRIVIIGISLAALGLGVTIASCSNGAPPFRPEILPLPSDPGEYAPLKGYAPMHIPDDNIMDPAKAALGRQLFFDKRLSGDGSRSCYSCHLNDKGLTDGIPTAIGAWNKKLTRNSPTLWNIGYHSEFYWDGRANSLEKQAFAAWKGGNMGAKDRAAVVAKINAIDGYHNQFQNVFGEGATEVNIPKALACYMRTIISQDTPYDRFRQGDESAISDSAKRGYEVFQKAKCDNCHSGLLFTDQQFHNVGVGMDVENPDKGRYKVIEEDKYMGAFKTPTLRDVADSAPYFHNGSAATLEDAVKFLVGGGFDNPNLDRTNLQKADLTDEEVAHLIEFLKSLDEPGELKEPELP